MIGKKIVYDYDEVHRRFFSEEVLCVIASERGEGVEDDDES